MNALCSAHQHKEGRKVHMNEQLGHATILARCCLLVLVAIASTALTAVTPALAQSPAATDKLPPFRIDLHLPTDIVLNADQGLGQCHWFDRSIVSQPYVTWAYDASTAISAWSTIEPIGGQFDWSAMDGLIAKAESLNRKLWIELLTTEGQTPEWARAAGVSIVGSRGGTPAPWNETYQRLLRRAVHAMAEQYDQNPTVDAINLMAGGCYGEMTICNTPQDTSAWTQAGYTDERYIEAVKQIIDIYLEDDYEWEDGTHSHGFRHKPVVLQLGGGLYGRTTKIINPVVEYAIGKYGMRVWLKYNGLGGGYDMGWLYEKYSHLTRVGYEPMGNSVEFLSKPEQFMRLALDHHSSYLCLQGTYFNVADQRWRSARELAARHLGAQIVHLGTKASETLTAGQNLTLTSEWVNRGTTPLFYGRRDGTQDIPASYQVQVVLVNPLTDAIVLENLFTPSPPTTQWHSTQVITVTAEVPLPVSMFGGEFDLRIALVNPSRALDDPWRSFRLVNMEAPDDEGRYTIGKVRVEAAATPTPSASATPEPTMAPLPTATPTPGPTSGLGSLLDALRRILQGFGAWLRGLFR